jgi:hypothetical protein
MFDYVKSDVPEKQRYILLIVLLTNACIEIEIEKYITKMLFVKWLKFRFSKPDNCHSTVSQMVVQTNFGIPFVHFSTGMVLMVL